MATSFGGSRYPSANAALAARVHRAQEQLARQRANSPLMQARKALVGLPGALSGRSRGYMTSQNTPPTPQTTEQTRADAHYARAVARQQDHERQIDDAITAFQTARSAASRASTPEVRASAQEAARTAEAAIHQLEDQTERVMEAVGRASARRDAAYGGPGVWMRYTDPEAEQALRQTLGSRATSTALARTVGAGKADTILISPAPLGGVTIMSKTDAGDSQYTLTRAPATYAQRLGVPPGTLVVLDPTVRSSGKTTATGDTVVRAMAGMRDLGVQRVLANAARGATWNGYDTWAKLGATGDLPRSVLSAAQAQFGGGVTRVEQVMDRPGGAAWWRQHGDSFDATMDLSPGGRSRAKLDRIEGLLNRRQQNGNTP